MDYKGLAAERKPIEDLLSSNPTDGETVDAQERISEIDQQRFNWLEYYKIKFQGLGIASIVGNLVLRPEQNLVFLVPTITIVHSSFERFFVGGDGLGSFSLDGRKLFNCGVSQSVTFFQWWKYIYNKFSLELRYPVTLKQLAWFMF